MMAISTGAARLVAAVLALAFLPAWGGVAFGQFGTPGSTDVRERVAGQLLSEDGGPTPEPGDQLGAFYRGGIVGVFTFTSDEPGPDFSFQIFGDNPATQQREGPQRGDRVEFRFYDSSSNTVYRRLGVRNAQGENFNYNFNGQEVPGFIDDFPFPIDLVPTAVIDLVVTSDPNDSGGFADGGGGPGDGNGGGGGGGGTEPDYDVDGDGRITVQDAALVLRVVSGASVSASLIVAADANRDGVVNTQDAIDILRARR